MRDVHARQTLFGSLAGILNEVGAHVWVIKLLYLYRAFNQYPRETGFMGSDHAAISTQFE